MKRLLLTSLAAVLLGSGCIIVPGNSRGDITFNWDFAGATCSQTQVASVKISIPGETLANAGVFPCLVDGAPGVTLHDFKPGTYTYTFEGLDSAGTVLFRKAGSVPVNGDVSVSVSLDWAVGGAEVAWTLSANSVNVSCASAGLQTMYVNFRGANGLWLYGESGDPQACNVTSVSYDYLPPGNYEVYVAGVDPSNRVYEPFNPQALPVVTVQAGNFNPAPISLSLVRK